jgi:hypothetical protein
LQSERLKEQVENENDDERHAHQPQKNACHEWLSLSEGCTGNNRGLDLFLGARVFIIPIGGNVLARNPAIAVAEVEEVISDTRPSSGRRR